MLIVNNHYLKLKGNYLFSEIAKRVAAYATSHPQARIIRLGIGDVTEPLPLVCREAMKKAADELGQRETFRGYGPEQGYSFLREAVAEHDFRSRGAFVHPDEIFISDGSKCDTGNFQELFSPGISVAVPDPVYPVYVDTNVMAGRTGEMTGNRYAGIVYLECKSNNGYIPEPPSEPVDLIYLCFPNNPTGAVANREQLTAWVQYAQKHGSLLLYDAAYAAFIQDESIPRSIYEIDGAREVAVEFRSFSKTAGFTGVRCAYTVVPKDLRVDSGKGEKISLHALWNRRHTTKFNGVSYPVQRAAEAVYTEQGQEQCRSLIRYYLENAAMIRTGMSELGFVVTGGDNAPYVWVQIGCDSWAFFDRLLQEAEVVCTPGAGFGQCGEGHIRLSAFNRRENVIEAMERMRQLLAGNISQQGSCPNKAC